MQNAEGPSTHNPRVAKAPCSIVANTWAEKGLPCHNFVYTRKLHGVWGVVQAGLCIRSPSYSVRAYQDALFGLERALNLPSLCPDMVL